MQKEITLTPDGLKWGFWQKSYIYILKELQKVAMIHGSLSSDLSSYSVSVRCLSAKKKKQDWQFSESPHGLGDGLVSFVYMFEENAEQSKDMLMMHAIKEYLIQKYGITANYDTDAVCVTK